MTNQSLLVQQNAAGSEKPVRGRVGNLTGIIGRIEQTVDAETVAIRTDIGFDIKASNARKSRYLYELNRAMKGLSPEDLDEDQRSGLFRLREKLEINEMAILAHLNAVKEVAGMLRDAIQHAEADGTYSANPAARA